MSVYYKNREIGFILRENEVDPTVPKYVKEITIDDINNWNNKASTDYVDTKISQLINSAPAALDTLGEIAKVVEENKDVLEALHIPKKLSELENDTQFITLADVPKTDLSNYYTKPEIDNLVGVINIRLENVLGVWYG